MDEADKLCDRIAIVDHGKLVALDSPLKLKASVPGQNMIEVSFSKVPAGWQETLKSLPDVAAVKESEGVFRISTNNGPRTAMALIEAARDADLTLSLTFSPEHDAGRRVRALHRPSSIARHAANRRRL